MSKLIIREQDILHNFDTVAKKTHALVIPVLKADGYGLGAERLAQLFVQHGVTMIAVSTLQEALTVCGKGVSVLLLSCYNDEAQLQRVIENDIICAVDNLRSAALINSIAGKLGKRAIVHIKVDTGFGRFGFNPCQKYEMSEVCRFENIDAQGIFSHFSSAFAAKTDIMDKQMQVFLDVIADLGDMGCTFRLRHIANSCAALRDKKYHMDAVRIGSALCGRLPMKGDFKLKRVGTLICEIEDIRFLKKGHNIGYGNVYTLKKDSKIAVLPIGTSDGLMMKKAYDTFRFFDIMRYGFNVFKMLFKDNRQIGLVNGKKARAVGRIALSHTMLDVTDIDCNVGDTVSFDLSPLYITQNVEREYV